MELSCHEREFVSSLRIFFIMVGAGLPGVMALAWLGLPVLVADRALPFPIHLLSMASALQGSLLPVSAAMVGARCASTVGLHAPVLSGLASGHPVAGVLARQCAPGMLGGLLGAALLWSCSRLSADVAAPRADMVLPLEVRVLCGGIAEEVLIRRGLMSALVWAL